MEVQNFTLDYLEHVASAAGLKFDKSAYDRLTEYVDNLRGKTSGHLVQFDTLRSENPEGIVDMHLVLSVVGINSIYVALRTGKEIVDRQDVQKALASIDYTHETPTDLCISTASYILRFAKI